MKLKYLIILNLIILIYTLFCKGNSNYKLYENGKAKFFFMYNFDKFIVYENYDNLGSSEKLDIVIQVDEISKIDEIAPYRLDKGSAIEEMKSLEKGKIGSGIDRAHDIELVKIDDIYGEIITVLTRDSIEDIFFERRLLFFNNNCRIIITLFGANDKIINANSIFFSYDKGSKTYSWLDKKGSNCFTDFFNSIKKLDKESPVVIWFNSIYEITKEIKINNSIVFFNKN